MGAEASKALQSLNYSLKATFNCKLPSFSHDMSGRDSLSACLVAGRVPHLMFAIPHVGFQAHLDLSELSVDKTA